MGNWISKGSTASTNVSKNEQNVTFNARSLGATKNQNIETLQVGTNLEATANVDWITNIAIQQNTAHGSNDKYYNIQFKVGQNSDSTTRNGKITFVYNGQEAYLNVTQAASQQTSYTLYVYDPSNLNTHFAYYRVNGGSVQDIPSGKTIQLYTYSSSTENNTITVELQPKSTQIASKFGFTTSTSQAESNIVKYTTPTIDQQYASQGFTALSYNTGDGYGYATTNNNDTIWGETVTTDASTFIKLAHMSPYPPINIYISNMLSQQKVLNVFSLFMANEEEYGGGVKLGDFCSFNDVPFPNSQQGDIEIKNNITANGIYIPLTVNVGSDIKEQINQQLEGDRLIIGKFIFKAKTATGNFVLLNITQDDSLFALAHQSTIMTVDLESRTGNHGAIVINFIDNPAYITDDLVNYTNQGDIYCTSYIDLKLPTGYIFSLNSGTYTDDHVRLNINLSVSISTS